MIPDTDFNAQAYEFKHSQDFENQLNDSFADSKFDAFLCNEPQPYQVFSDQYRAGYLACCNS